VRASSRLLISSGMPPADPLEARLLSRALLLYFVVAFGSMTGFYLLLSVVPLYATAAGAGRAGAGLTTGVLMLATVVAELATPALTARLGYRAVLGLGLALLGAPALALTLSGSLAAIVAVSVVRGVGLAILVVAGSALVAKLVPPARRSQGIGLSGVVVGIPAVTALPLGVWLTERTGFAPVFVAAAAATLAPLIVLPALPGPRAAGPAAIGVLDGLRSPGQVRPAGIFLLTAMGAGIVATFVPLVTAAAGGDVGHAAAALFANAIAATGGRWWAGHRGDRHGQARLLVAGVVVCALGMLALALGAASALVMPGAVLLGLGFGVAQNASLSLMFERVSPAGYDTVSAVWNLAYDAGMGIGAAGFGALSVRTGYAGAFGIVAAVLGVALVPVWRDRGWLAPGEAPALAESAAD
jgi:predicted MFS family arabinose efflux permease